MSAPKTRQFTVAEIEAMSTPIWMLEIPLPSGGLAHLEMPDPYTPDDLFKIAMALFEEIIAMQKNYPSTFVDRK